MQAQHELLQWKLLLWSLRGICFSTMLRRKSTFFIPNIVIFFFKEDPDPPVDVGGDYFNRYQGYKLGGKISGENFSSLSDAKNRCSALKSSCSGVVNDYAGHYYLSTSYTFSSASGHTTYEKGEKGRVKICFSIQ